LEKIIKRKVGREIRNEKCNFALDGNVVSGGKRGRAGGQKRDHLPDQRKK